MVALRPVTTGHVPRVAVAHFPTAVAGRITWLLPQQPQRTGTMSATPGAARKKIITIISRRQCAFAHVI